MIATQPTERDHVVQLAAGIAHTVLCTSGGSVLTFGSNSDGQLGRSGAKPPASPLRVAAQLLIPVQTFYFPCPEYISVLERATGTSIRLGRRALMKLASGGSLSLKE
jgi:alpha-tubulin suppressor-like RCC1 family protein